jgi:hypothetical protein
MTNREILPLDTELAKYPGFETEMDGLADIADLPFETGTTSVGFAVIDDETHDWVIEQLVTRLAEAQPTVVSSEKSSELLKAITSVINQSRSNERAAKSAIILDLAQTDYNDPENQTAINAILMSLNVGRSLLANAATITTIVVPEAHFELYQQLPDLYSTRGFVARFLLH